VSAREEMKNVSGREEMKSASGRKEMMENALKENLLSPYIRVIHSQNPLVLILPKSVTTKSEHLTHKRLRIPRPG
jgi:hypothetical protein